VKLKAVKVIAILLTIQNTLVPAQDLHLGASVNM